MITFNRIWSDGRSGRLGQLVGDIVLGDIADRFGPLAHRKGTVFESAGVVIIGRVCATDRYLPYPEIHWSTFDPRQEPQLRADPELAERNFYFLFITGMPRAKAVAYWLIPSATVAEATAQTRRRKDGAVFVRICEEQGKSILNGMDISRFRHRIDLDAAQQGEVESAEGQPANRSVRVDRNASKRQPNARPSRSEMPLAEGIDASASPSTVVIGQDGVVVLPAGLFGDFPLTEGMRAVAYRDGGRIILQPVRPHEYRAARGSLKGTGSLKALADERRREREL